MNQERPGVPDPQRTIVPWGAASASAPRAQQLSDLASAIFDGGQFTPGTHAMLLDCLAAQGLEPRIWVTTNSLAAQIAAAANGPGVAILSRRRATRFPERVHLLPEALSLEIDLWLVTHEDLRRSARCNI